MGCCLAGFLVLGRRLCGWRCPRRALVMIAALELASLLSFAYLHRVHIATFLGLAVSQEICTAPAA